MYYQHFIMWVNWQLFILCLFCLQPFCWPFTKKIQTGTTKVESRPRLKGNPTATDVNNTEIGINFKKSEFDHAHTS